MCRTLMKVLSAFAAILMTVTAFAQVTTSSIVGRVVDESGDPLAGAAVLAVHTPTGSQYFAVANNEGRFTINGMRAGGPYKVEVSFLGMASVEYDDITLKLGEAYEIDPEMKSVNELNAVTVVGEKSFNASITGAGSSFSLAQVESMPTIDRSIYDVVKFTPQATLNKNGGISFAGSNNRYNSFQIDGAVANDSFGLSSSGTNGGQTGANPISIDAIEEVQVVIAPFDVRQSGFTGGAINAITKSGTNQVKGSFYTHFFNQDLIGTTPGSPEQMKDNWSKTERTKYDNELCETYGFTAGAPIIKNKLFLFTSAEYYKKTYPNVYSPALDSYESRPLSKEVFYNGKSLGNVFNTAMADAIIEKYKTTYNPAAGFSETYSQHQVTDRSINVLARIDWNINDANKFMFRYQYADAFADQYGSGKSTYYFNNSSYKQVNKTNTFVAELNSRISDNVSNELRATAVLVRDHREPGYAGATMYIKDKVYFDLGTEYSSGANSMSSDTYTLTDNLSIFAGKHNITLGTHNEFFKFNNVFIQYAYGEYTYATLADFFADSYTQYDYKYADPVYTGGETRWAATTYALELGLYAQDEWKPTRDFTLTYGIRVDAPMLLNKPTANETFNATGFAKDNGEYVGVVPKVQPLFSPRVGFRWYLNDDHSSLFRGGAGLFTGRVPFVWLSNAYNNTGVETKSVTSKQPGLPLTSDPYNDIIKAGKLSGTASGATINTLNENFKYPQVLRVNLGYDQEFGLGWKLTLDAIFSKTLNNVFFKNLAITSNSRVYGVNAAVAGSNPDSTAPFYTQDSGDYYCIVALGNTNKGYTYSLSGKLEKHFDWGLDLMAAYTFGHSFSINDGTSSVAFSNWKYNYSIDTNDDTELAHSLFDRPHKVSAVASYTTPRYGRFRTNIALTYQGNSGQRFCYTMKESNFDFNGDGQYGNSLLYIPSKDELVQMSWTNPESAAKFENFIRNDEYLSGHRGQWSTRYAGIGRFENHFDLQVTEDFFYDRKSGRKLQLIANLLNLGNLLNREWGMYYSASYNRTILQVDNLAKDAKGNYVPTYSYYDDNTIGLSDFYSRWRCQIGLRLTF